MTVRVRFAPSPTGYLHIGGARTALYSYLFAKAKGGSFILRIEDTDLERSKKEYEESQIADLNWLGINHDEGPGKPGEFGPYRQSERLDIYKKYAEQFIQEGKAFYCFCSDETLEQKKEKALAEKRSPHYDGTCRHLKRDDVDSRLAAGEKPVVRFIAPLKSYEFHDVVRKKVTFPEDMVGDFVIIRSNGLPVYNFCCVIDDWLMKMTHVLRAEEHLPNTLRQLMVYEGLGATPPQFGHVSLLIGQDRQKLSKRHGATSVQQYRDLSYLPEAMVNYLALLGWSHPEEKDVFDLDELIKVFDIDRFNKAPAMFDLEKLNHVNGQHLRQVPVEQLISAAEKVIPQDHIWQKQTADWKARYMNLFIEKIQTITEINDHLEIVFSDTLAETEEYKEILSWETTPQIREYLSTELKKLASNNQTFVEPDQLGEWLDYCKKELKIKGKPLFQGFRASLTGQGHGPDLKELVPLTPLETLVKRLEQ